MAENSVQSSDVNLGQGELVKVEGVTKSFGWKDALENLSFSVPAGQLCGLLGPNGAGKTTLFRLLMGILKPTSGNLLVDSLDAFEDRVAESDSFRMNQCSTHIYLVEKFLNSVLPCMAWM